MQRLAGQVPDGTTLAYLPFSLGSDEHSLARSGRYADGFLAVEPTLSSAARVR
jgi:hypothetical protein